MTVAQTPEHLQAVGEASRVYVTCLTAILFYDWLTTLSQESRLFWKPVFRPAKNTQQRRLGLSALAFYLPVRYLAIVQFAVILAMIWREWSKTACQHIYRELDQDEPLLPLV